MWSLEDRLSSRLRRRTRCLSRRGCQIRLSRSTSRWLGSLRRPSVAKYVVCYLEIRGNEPGALVDVHPHPLLCLWWYLVLRRRKSCHPLLPGRCYPYCHHSACHRPGQAYPGIYSDCYWQAKIENPLFKMIPLINMLDVYLLKLKFYKNSNSNRINK